MNVLKTNDLVGNYKIISKFGEGGMAHIYKAAQPSLKRTVVLKQLKDPNREIIDRFKNEALLSASFHHENLVTIYEFLYINRNYYLVMEFVDGEDLRTIIDHASPLPVHAAALIALGIARGLEYTHARGIIHRDVKPSNILVSRDGEVKIIDFGIAKDDVSTKLTMTGMIVGTPAYMAPEQANGDPLSVQSDVFSLGILLYEMLTGMKPFLGENNTEILARIVRNKYIAPERLNPAIPVTLRRIVKKTLRKDPIRRYQNSTDMIHDLEKAIPWQLRSHKKKMIAHMMGRLNKDRPLTSSTIDMAVYSGPQSWAWRLFRYSLSAIIIFSLFYLGTRFADHHLGHARVNLPAADYIVQLDKKEARSSGKTELLLGPLFKGVHQIQVHDPAGQSINYHSILITPSDTTEIDIQANVSTLPSAMNIYSVPSAAVVIMDGDSIGRTPIHEYYILPGPVCLELINKDGGSVDDTLLIHAGKQYDLTFTIPGRQPQE